MPRDGLTGLVMPVPAADHLLSVVERRHPGAVRPGVPAHLSLLYPFLPTTDLEDIAANSSVKATLAALFAAQPPISTQFRRCRRRDGFVYLLPDPATELEKLTAAVRGHFPQITPYAGRYQDVGPHVTVAMGASADSADAIERDVNALFPVTAELSEAWLVAFQGQWSLRDRYPFGGH